MKIRRGGTIYDLRADLAKAKADAQETALERRGKLATKYEREAWKEFTRALRLKGKARRVAARRVEHWALDLDSGRISFSLDGVLFLCIRDSYMPGYRVKYYWQLYVIKDEATGMQRFRDPVELANILEA